MIGRLRGAVAEIGEEDALIDVGGVGYVVRCGARTLGRLPGLGDETVIHVETQWSEATGQRLYGFLSRNATNPTLYFRLPPDQVMEIGTQVDL